MAKIEAIISDPLFERLQKISELLDIEFEEILQLCLVDGGYYKYWLPIDKFIEDTSNLVDSPDSTDNIYDIKTDLKHQFHERFEVISDIDSLENRFKKKFKHIKSDVEQHRAFLDFIDITHSESIIASEESLEVKEAPPVIQQEQESYKEVEEEPIVQEQMIFPFKLLPKKYVPMLILIAVSDFLTIKFVQLFWSNFTFLDILQYNPLNFFPYFLIIIFTSLITGALYRHYYNKYKASIPIRKDTKEYKEYIREFDSQNPRTYSKDPVIQIRSDIRRLQKLERFLKSKT